MSNAQLRIIALALSLTVVTASRGEDRKDAFGDPLPPVRKLDWERFAAARA